MSLIQHTLALLAGDRERAETLVEGLESLSHRHDPIVLHARLKATLSFLIGTEADHRQMYDQTVAAQPTLFHKAVVGLTFVEHLVRLGSESALSVLKPSPFRMHGRRWAHRIIAMLPVGGTSRATLTHPSQPRPLGKPLVAFVKRVAPTLHAQQHDGCIGSSELRVPLR